MFLKNGRLEASQPRGGVVRRRGRSVPRCKNITNTTNLVANAVLLLYYALASAALTALGTLAATAGALAYARRGSASAGNRFRISSRGASGISQSTGNEARRVSKTARTVAHILASSFRNLAPR